MSGPEDLPPPGVPNEEAIRFFRSKGYRIGFNWQDVDKLEHARAFTVAKAMSRDLLEDIREEVDRAIADGTTLDDFRKSLRPRLEARGWWGRKRMVDPLTAQSKVVQLGSPRRLKTIYNANLRSAYAAGKWERGERVKSAFPFLEYSCLMDGRERPQHHAWHGTILPRDHVWWETHTGPCDWECRCDAVPRSQRWLDRNGKTVSPEPEPFPDYEWSNPRTGETGRLEEGVGKGWDYNVGKEYLRGLAPPPMPTGGGGAREVAKAMTRVEEKQVDRFLGALGIEPGGSAIWSDRDGWPLSIGRGWFISRNGGARVPKSVALDRIAAAIVTPDSIQWIWAIGVNGRKLLMRRYERKVNGLTTRVEVGREGWRWGLGRGDVPDEG